MKKITVTNKSYSIFPSGVMQYIPNFGVEKKTDAIQDLIIIGGGIMGLMTAYFASKKYKNIIILEKRTIGNKQAASFSLTRSMRNDYIDPRYSSLANTAKILWEDLEKECNKKFLINCGCLNLVKNTLSPEESKTYAQKSYQTLTSLNLKTKRFSQKTLRQTYPQFTVDAGYLDYNGGFLYLPTITKNLLKKLQNNKVTLLENIDTQSIQEKKQNIVIQTNKGVFTTKKLIITSGIWTNEVLKKIEDCSLQFPITSDKPKECKYYIPSEKMLNLFTSDKMPVFAYLDIGIYGHPIYIGKTPGVKISYYNPPEITKEKTKINTVQAFVDECMPLLKNAKVTNVTNADQCSYDMVSDKNFILGQLPNYQNIFVGTGWNGTGYKFAPLVGKILTELCIKNKSSYPIEKFLPERFMKYEQ